MLTGLPDRPYFFDKGIRFACTGCGACCTGAPGTVYMSSGDIRAAAIFLSLSERAFIRLYLYPFRDSYSIRESIGGSCLFYDRGCTIYPVRPLQCLTFPFWTRNLRSEKTWTQVASHCPGIDRGTLFTREEILDLIDRSPI